MPVLQADSRTLLLILSTALLISGCQEPPKPTVSQFVEKPIHPPQPIRTYDEVMDLFARPESGGTVEEEWRQILGAAPQWAQNIHGEAREAVPATPWYEYLRCGEDYSSSLDEALTDDYLRLVELADTEDVNAALRQLVVGTVAFELGLMETATRHFRKAVYWMEEATDVALENLAALGRSDVKIYKGDAYERSMVHFYLGISAYIQQDYRSARREFHRALMADMSKPEETERGNFALLHYWLGKSYARLGDIGNTRVAVNKALACDRPSMSEPLFDLNAISNDNLTILVQLGAGARLVPRGADWQVTAYEKTQYPERAAEVFIDGQHIGPAIPIADLWRQISTQGVSEEQKIQQGKAAGKAILQALPYISILGVAWDVTGDMRSWSMLPGEIHVWSGTIAPGEHTVTIRVYDENDLEMTRYRQSWYFVPVRDGEDRLLVIRTGRDKCCQREEDSSEN